MPPKTDSRLQLNIKSSRVTHEFLAKLRRAAEDNGQGITDFVLDQLDEAINRWLKSEPAPGAAVPARPEDVRDVLAELLATQREQAAQLARLGRQSRVRGRVARR